MSGAPGKLLFQTHAWKSFLKCQSLLSHPGYNCSANFTDEVLPRTWELGCSERREAAQG